MASRIVDPQHESQKRELRRRIGRLRRRIDRRVHSTGREARRLVSWRTYVTRRPGNAVTAALGVGLALSAGLSARRLSRWLGLWMVRRAAGDFTKHLWRELGRLWAESEPGTKPSQSDHGADHDGA